VPIEAELGGVGEVRTKLQEERPEVAIDTVDVVVVDHGRALDDPGVPLTGRRVGPLLRPEDPSLLLGFADKEHPFGGGEAGQVRRHHVVLPLLGREDEEGHVRPGGVGFEGLDEGLADRLHEG
jgi:hypothetical protein